MSPQFTRRTNPSASACRFEETETRFVGLVEDGAHLRATDEDPQIHLRPSTPIPAGWCVIELGIDDELREPKVYLDFGEGFSETWTAILDWYAPRGVHRSVFRLPWPVVALRIDPCERPARFRLESFTVDIPGPHELSGLLLQRELPAPPSDALAAEPHRLLGEDGVNAQLIVSWFSHFSGLSLRLDPAEARAMDLVLEVYTFGPEGPRLVRTAPLDVANVAAGGWEHYYWAPIEDSLGRYHLLRLVARSGDGADLSRARILRGARVIHSSPEPTAELPQAVCFSPVTQCNLNCVHCISQPSRTRFARATESLWEEVRAIAKAPGFLNLHMDYSGDILFDEVRHGGWLSKIMALDVPYRIDTNANCLDDEIGDKLIASRLYEINFSLDSMDTEVYPAIRRGSIPLPEVLAKIARFMERKRAAAAEFHTLLSFVLMRSNAHTIKPAFAFARDHGIDSVSVVSLIAFTPDMVEELFIWDETAYRTLYDELFAEATRHGISLNMQAPIERWRDREGHAPCYAAQGTALILGNGDVMACCIPGTRIGNLHETSLRELWNGPAYREFRTRVNSDDPPDTCRNCPIIRLDDNRKAYAPARYGPRTSTIALPRRRRPRETPTEA